MKEYFIAKGNEKVGPFSAEELKLHGIESSSLIWSEGMDGWKEAGEITELQELLKKLPPPIPTQTSMPEMPQKKTLAQQSKYEYSQVEDIAGVDYKKAYLITGVFIAAHFLLPTKFFHSFIGFFGIFIFPIIIWSYFKKFFQSIGDRKTGQFVNYIMVAYVVYFIAVTLISIIVSDDMYNTSMFEILFEGFLSILDPEYVPRFPETERYFTFLMITGIAFFAVFVLIWISGIKLLRVKNRYKFPLGRIAWSAMICIPFSILTLLSNDNYANSWFVWEAVLLLPYIFLFIHFYKADTLDATPD
jgi:hypothetical protein